MAEVTKEELAARILEHGAEVCIDLNGIVREERVVDFASDYGLDYVAARQIVDEVLNGSKAQRRAGRSDDRKIRERMEVANLSYGDAASELARSGELERGRHG